MSAVLIVRGPYFPGYGSLMKACNDNLHVPAKRSVAQAWCPHPSVTAGLRPAFLLAFRCAIGWIPKKQETPVSPSPGIQGEVCIAGICQRGVTGAVDPYLLSVPDV
jgi:hypothetical protein